MRKRITRGLALSGLALLVSALGVAPLRGQDPRDACLAQASREPDSQRRLPLLMCALNPSAGAPHGAWPVGVQLLAQTLIEDGQDSIAAVWLRWAARLAPDLQPDTVTFLPRVVAAYRAARDFVSRTRTRWDTAAGTTWQWPAHETGERVGRLQVSTSAAAVPVRIFVDGVGLVAPGGTASIAPGSYAVSVTAAGYDSLHVTREVLPGVTTLVEFHLPSRTPPVASGPRLPQQQPQADKPKQAPPVVPEKGGGIPVWAKVGVAGGIVWAILWNVYIKSH